VYKVLSCGIYSQSLAKKLSLTKIRKADCQGMDKNCQDHRNLKTHQYIETKDSKNTYTKKKKTHTHTHARTDKHTITFKNLKSM
jgi:hypothetical protein